MFYPIITIRVISAVIVLMLLLALPAEAIYADGNAFLSATDVQQNDGAALLCLALVGGVAVLAASALLLEFRKLL